MEKLTFAEVNIDEMTESARIIVENMLGRKVSDADPVMLLLKSFIAIIAQQRQIIDEAANQNLLYYATGKNLEAIGELVGVKRKKAAAATCHVQLTLSTSRNKVTNYASGIRFNAGDNLNFALAENVTFLAGETVKTAKAICLEAGEIGNAYKIGEINRIVDPQPYLSKIENITETEGGADVESDENLRERIRIAPESFSVAGSRGAYIFWTKTFSTEIIDAIAVSPQPGFVDIYFLLEGGKVPGAEMIQDLQEYLSADEIRPLTDFVTVKPCEVVKYDIDCEYFISRENATNALSIQAAVEKAIEDFKLWQSNQLGKDISQNELVYRIRAAGTDRVIVNLPQFQVVPENAVAICENCNVVYKGLKTR